LRGRWGALSPQQILGLNASGKTVILSRLRLGEVVTPVPTMGFNVERVQHDGTELELWEVSGGDKIWPMFRHYYPGTAGLVYVVDSTERDSEWLATARDRLFEFILTHDDLAGVPLLVLANKQDRPGALSAHEVAAALGLAGPPVPGGFMVTAQLFKPRAIDPGPPPSPPPLPHVRAPITMRHLTGACVCTPIWALHRARPGWTRCVPGRGKSVHAAAPPCAHPLAQVVAPWTVVGTCSPHPPSLGRACTRASRGWWTRWGPDPTWGLNPTWGPDPTWGHA
jgi:small GTP-binding protein